MMFASFYKKNKTHFKERIYSDSFIKTVICKARTRGKIYTKGKKGYSRTLKQPRTQEQ